MGSFARLAANALREFIGDADDVVTKGSDDLVATQVVKSDSSKTFGEGTQRIKYTDPKSNSFIEVVQRPKGAASVIGLEVPEKFRGLGIGQSLQEIAMKDNPDLMGQVSSKAAATTAYRLGRRPSTKSDATLEEVFSMIDKDSSVNMVTLKGSKITRALDPDDPDVLSDIARKNETFPKRVQEALFAWNKRDGGISSKELRKILKEEGWADKLDIREIISDANNVGTTQLIPPKSFDPEQKALMFEFNKGGIVKKGLMAR